MDQGFPAWLVCEEILNKAKDELITEAIEVLHEEMKRGRISFKGSMVNVPERDADFERDRFLINELLQKEEEVRRVYGPYIEGKRNGAKGMDATMIQRVEEAERFLLAVTQIVILMRMSKVMDTWLSDVGMYPKIKDPAEILASTVHRTESEFRIDALRFVLSSKTFIRERIFTQDERNILEKALDKAVINEKNSIK
jgi:hypothetical protein